MENNEEVKQGFWDSFNPEQQNNVKVGIGQSVVLRFLEEKPVEGVSKFSLPDEEPKMFLTWSVEEKIGDKWIPKKWNVSAFSALRSLKQSTPLLGKTFIVSKSVGSDGRQKYDLKQF